MTRSRVISNALWSERTWTCGKVMLSWYRAGVQSYIQKVVKTWMRCPSHPHSQPPSFFAFTSPLSPPHFYPCTSLSGTGPTPPPPSRCTSGNSLSSLGLNTLPHLPLAKSAIFSATPFKFCLTSSPVGCENKTSISSNVLSFVSGINSN